MTEPDAARLRGVRWILVGLGLIGASLAFTAQPAHAGLTDQVVKTTNTVTKAVARSLEAAPQAAPIAKKTRSVIKKSRASADRVVKHANDLTPIRTTIKKTIKKTIKTTVKTADESAVLTTVKKSVKATVKRVTVTPDAPVRPTAAPVKAVVGLVRPASIASAPTPTSQPHTLVQKRARDPLPTPHRPAFRVLRLESSALPPTWATGRRSQALTARSRHRGRSASRRRTLLRHRNRRVRRARSWRPPGPLRPRPY